MRWTKEGIEYGADEVHSEKFMEAEGLEVNSNTAVGPAIKIDGGKEALDEVGLKDMWKHKEFRRRGARLSYL